MRRDTFDVVKKIGLAMPDVEESVSRGFPVLKVHGKLLACMAIHKSAEPGSLVVRIDFDQREGLLAEAPGTYYVTDHYRNYPSVLVRLSEITTEQLRDLLRSAWQFVTAEKSRKVARAAVKRKGARLA